MRNKNDKQLVVGLDIGTSKVVAIVGEYEPGEPIEIIGEPGWVRDRVHPRPLCSENPSP